MTFDEPYWETIRKLKMGDVRWELLPADDAIPIGDIRAVEPIKYEEPKRIEPLAIKEIVIEPRKEIVKRPRNEGSKSRSPRKPPRKTA
jgi:hypothetical protein